MVCKDFRSWHGSASQKGQPKCCLSKPCGCTWKAPFPQQAAWQLNQITAKCHPGPGKCTHAGMSPDTNSLALHQQALNTADLLLNARCGTASSLCRQQALHLADDAAWVQSTLGGRRVLSGQQKPHLRAKIKLAPNMFSKLSCLAYPCVVSHFICTSTQHERCVHC